MASPSDALDLTKAQLATLRTTAESLCRVGRMVMAGDLYAVVLVVAVHPAEEDVDDKALDPETIADAVRVSDLPAPVVSQEIVTSVLLGRF